MLFAHLCNVWWFNALRYGQNALIHFLVALSSSLPMSYLCILCSYMLGLLNAFYICFPLYVCFKENVKLVSEKDNPQGVGNVEEVSNWKLCFVFMQMLFCSDSFI